MNKHSAMNSTKIIIIAATLSLTTSVAAAPKDRFPIDLEALDARAAERFSNMDANNDGQIDRGEFESAENKRSRQGKKHSMSGKHPRPYKRLQGEPQEMRAAVQAELFALLDADENGQLSSEEHAAQTRETAQLARKKAMFKKLDINSDGVLVPEELPRPGARLRAVDANGDGQVTRQEMRSFRAG